MTFADFDKKVEDVHGRFKETAAHEVLYPEFKVFEGDYAIDVHARYFTERRYAPNVRHTPFPEDIDPLHILETLRGADFIHGPDNEVQYLKMVRDESDVARYACSNVKWTRLTEDLGTRLFLPRNLKKAILWRQVLVSWRTR